MNSISRIHSKNTDELSHCVIVNSIEILFFKIVFLKCPNQYRNPIFPKNRISSLVLNIFTDFIAVKYKFVYNSPIRIQDLINSKLELSNLTGFQNLSGLVSDFIKSAFLNNSQLTSLPPPVNSVAAIHSKDYHFPSL